MSEPESVLMRGAGGVITRYIREDHAAKMLADHIDRTARDSDAIWNEAIEAAALKMEELAGDWKRERQLAYAHALFIEAKAIRALKRPRGGN